MESPCVTHRDSDSSSYSEDPPAKSFKNDNNSVAKFLLKNRFLLTALEFHMELLERGYENPELRDYFSNPGNFEAFREESTPAKPLARTSSVTTFDSLDFTRMSDDGNPSENRIQTLEYQLRAANEKIQKLQNELTFLSEEKKFPSGSDSNIVGTNFHGDSQLVGSVIQASSDGDHLPRRRDGSMSGVPHMGSGTVCDPLSLGGPILPHEKRALNYLVNEYLLQHNYKITSNTFGDENEGEDLESWDEVGLHIAQPPGLLPLLRDFGSRIVADSPATSCGECQVEIISEEQLQELREENNDLIRSLDLSNVRAEDLMRRVEEMQTELLVSRDNVVRLEKELIERRLTGSEDVPIVITDENTDPTEDEPLSSVVGFEGRRSPEGASENPRQVCPNFINELQKNLVPPEADFSVSSQPEALLKVLGQHLPSLVRSAETDATRECLLPLLVYSACLHPEQGGRDRLLHVLFNLSPKPNATQRRLILQGCRSLSRYLGPRRVEAELLPQLWEQIGHPEVSRRRLVAEACSALMEFIPALLRNSLLFSMLQQMLEDRDSEVRVAVVRALALLTATLSDSDKLNKMQELLFSNSCLYDDICEAVADSSRRYLLPAVAQWCLETDCLHTQLLDNILARLEQPFVPSSSVPLRQDENSIERVSQHVNHLLLLVPYIGMWVKTNAASVDGIADENTTGCVRDLLKAEQNLLEPHLGSELFSPSLVLNNGQMEAYGRTLSCYETFIRSTASEGVGWSITSLRWLHTELAPKLAYVLRRFPVSDGRGPSVAVERLCRLLQLLGRLLGPIVTHRCFEAILRRELSQQAVEDGKFGIDAVGSNLLAGLCVGVLPVLEQYEEIISILEEAVELLSACQRPLNSVRIAFTLLISICGRTEIVPELLARLTSSRNPCSRAAAGQLFHAALVSGQLLGQDILSNHVLPRLAELANDRDIGVRGCCYRALAHAVVLIWSGGCGSEAEERANFLFRQMVADCEASWLELSYAESQQHFVQKELLTAFAETAQNLPCQLRDQVVLPHLLHCVERRPCSSFNATRREETAQALQNCFTTLLHMSGLTISGIQDFILPAIEKLKSDLATVGSERQHTLALIISDYQLLMSDQEAKIDSNANASGDGGQSSVKSRMLSKFRDFRESTSGRQQQQPRQASPNPNSGHFASIFQRKK